MIVATLQVASRPFGMLPARAGGPSPPRVHILKIDRPIRRREYHRAGLQHFVGWLRRPRRHLLLQLLPIHWPLRRGLVASRLDEFAELPIRHIVLVKPKAIHGDLVRRLLIAP